MVFRLKLSTARTHAFCAAALIPGTFFASGAAAQTAPPATAPPATAAFGQVSTAKPVAAGVTVSSWAGGLSGPQGLVSDGHGGVLVVENGAGRVTRFGPDGKKRDVVAEGLRAPAFAVRTGGEVYIAERDGNTVAVVPAVGRRALTRLSGQIEDPLGLAVTRSGGTGLLVVSHRQSTIRRFVANRGAFTLEAKPFLLPASGAKYGWRDLAVAPDGGIYVTDEVSGAILRRKPGGALEVWASGLSSPSGLAFGRGGSVYVTEEGNGRVSHVAPNGTVTPLAEGLGKARSVLLLSPNVLLVSDRAGGNVWKVTLPTPRR